ncbi:MAG TPA: peptidoglycan-binding domain-containing protein [Methanobacterium sp.]|nr:peptidoglycan-binding domain-containing protein [Methanobacterium sp.]
MKGKIKKTIYILLAVFFIASLTAVSASACSCYLRSPVLSGDSTLQHIAANQYPYSLHYGSSGHSVKLVQEVLMDLGYYLGSSGADGYYGYYTANAVKSFQSSHGLYPDGIVGPCTLCALDHAIINLCPRCLPY